MAVLWPQLLLTPGPCSELPLPRRIFLTCPSGPLPASLKSAFNSTLPSPHARFLSNTVSTYLLSQQRFYINFRSNIALMMFVSDDKVNQPCAYTYPPPPEGHPSHRPPQQSLTTPHMLTVSAAQPPFAVEHSHPASALLCSAAGSTPRWQRHSTFNDYLLGPVTFEGLHASAPWLFPHFPYFPPAFLLGLLSSTHASLQLLSGCHLVQAAFLIISVGTADSTVLASNLCLLPRDSSGSLGWSHHGHVKAAPSHQGLLPTSLQVLAVTPPYLFPALLWLEAFLSHPL